MEGKIDDKIRMRALKCLNLKQDEERHKNSIRLCVNLM